MPIIESSPAVTPTSPPEQWVDITTVGRHLHFGRTMVAAMAKSGKIPAHAHRNGRRVYWRFKLSQVDAALMQTAEECGKG